MTSTDVIVIGAGPVGLTTAIALRRLGLDVRVLDRAAHTKREARAAVLWQRELEILRDIGVVDPFLAAGNHLHRAHVHVASRRLGALDLGGLETEFPHPLAIEQDSIERLLADAAAATGVCIEWGAEVTAVHARADGAAVDIRTGSGERILEAAWVVGCEGSRSPTRAALGARFDGGRRENLQVVQINADLDWAFPYDPTQGHFFLRPGAALAVFPRPGGGYRVFCFLTDPDPTLTAEPSSEEMRRLIADVTGREVALTPTDPRWTNRARFQDRIADPLRGGRLVVAGDAVHVWAPVGGHGMNTGIRGAHNLAWKLAAVHRGRAHGALLDTYTHEQRASAKAVITEMRFNVLEQPPTRALMRVLTAVLPVALGFGPAERRIQTLLSDLTKHHRASRLSVDRLRVGAVRAGDRIPDEPVVTDGRRQRLHHLLSYDRWTLLVADRDAHRAREHLDRWAPRADDRMSVHAISTTAGWAPPGSVTVIRPDGHIGMRAPAEDHSSIEDYLQLWLPRVVVPTPV